MQGAAAWTGACRVPAAPDRRPSTLVTPRGECCRCCCMYERAGRGRRYACVWRARVLSTQGGAHSV